ncbi:MAG: DUF6662 family protein [Verrucomicrobiota bacterium]
MKRERNIAVMVACGLLAVASAPATERIFTYTYEPETLPKGVFEAEQWVTLRAGRNAAVGQEDYYRLQFREELEYGVTDNYQIALYFNHQYEHFKNPATGARTSHYRQKGFSLENKLLVLNPAEHMVGLALYLEPTLDAADGMFKLEEKIILGQRHGDWKWAFNLTHETEWEHDYQDTVGEFEATFGIARQLGFRWSLGVEMRHHAETEEYRDWEGYAFYLGPVLSYRRDRWWAALTVMPQIYGANFQGDPDGESSLDLDGHERVNVRLLFGFSF